MTGQIKIMVDKHNERNTMRERERDTISELGHKEQDMGI